MSLILCLEIPLCYELSLYFYKNSQASKICVYLLQIILVDVLVYMVFVWEETFSFTWSLFGKKRSRLHGLCVGRNVPVYMVFVWEETFSFTWSLCGKKCSRLHGLCVGRNVLVYMVFVLEETFSFTWSLSGKKSN